MENELKQSEEHDFDQHFCKKLAGAFSHSKGRAGKPIVKWTEVHSSMSKLGSRIGRKAVSQSIIQQRLRGNCLM